jgi:RNA-directed DNA polymerase
MSNTEKVECWEQIDWRKVEKTVFKLQKRIYKASLDGDVRKVRKLQKTLLRSWSNKVLAVRRVTQDNQGKKTAGVDGIKSLNPKQRYALAKELRITGKCKPTRRVWIPKPNGEQRPLGIPVMYDRALQGVVKAALEPEWEALFESNSYGFRPARSCQDAIRQIKLTIQTKAKYVLDADIAKCFDRINHKRLLQKLGVKGQLRQQIRSWLKSGVIDKNVFAKTEQGTPQGGVVSPLLANVALHGMEEGLKDFVEKIPVQGIRGKNKRRALGFIRYADDFVLIHRDKNIVLKCQEYLERWLADIGLELKPEKTRLTHTLDNNLSEDKKAGFDFL